MPDQTIAGLPLANALDGTEAFYALQGGVDKRATASQVKTYSTPPSVVGFPQGRLTLQTGVSVMSATQSAKTTIFYTPYVGNQVPIYDGTNWAMTPFTESSQLTTDNTKSPGSVVGDRSYDMFVWNDGGTIRCTRGPAWFTDNTRGGGSNALVMVNGILLNAGTITNGPTAQRGTYVGTVRSNTSMQIDWIFGGLGIGGAASIFGVWNAYNRRPVCAFVGDNTDSWTYSSNAWRAANASTTIRHNFVVGQVEDAFSAIYNQIASSDGTNRANVGIGINSTTAHSGATSFTISGSATPLLAACNGLPALGYNFVSALERQDAATGTFRGDNGLPAYVQTGLSINGLMM